MTEENKFKPVDSINLYDGGIGYVKLYDASHANESEEQRIWTVSTLASIAYGNEEAKNPRALYERLKTLKHESLWEFIRTGANIPEQSNIAGSMREYELNGIEYPLIVSKHYDKNIACFRIKAPIFVARQFFRHRAFSYIEMSRRYTKPEKQEFQFWRPSIGNRIGTKAVIDTAENSAMHTYHTLLMHGEHTQVASRFLPQTTYTEFYIMGEVEGLKNFFQLRLDSHAQAEIRELAQGMLDLLFKHQPELASKVTPSN